MTVYEPGSGSSTDTESAGTLTLDFPAPELLEINSVVYKPPSLLYSVIYIYIYIYRRPDGLRQKIFVLRKRAEVFESEGL